jgi:hypothetical protein
VAVNEKPSDNALNPMNQKVYEVSTMENPNNYNQTQFTPSIGRDVEAEAFGTKSLFENPYSGETASMLERQMDRLKLEGSDRESFLTNIHNFARDTRIMESDDNPLAVNIPQAGQEQTSAKGAYQFTDASVDTARQRMRNLGFGDEFIQGISSDPREWAPEQADAMFLSNVIAQTGSDEYLRSIGSGEQGKAREAYYKFHHTSPDEATIKRAQNFFF